MHQNPLAALAVCAALLGAGPLCAETASAESSRVETAPATAITTAPETGAARPVEAPPAARPTRSGASQVYAYVDEAGQVHFAKDGSDPRFQLFLRDPGEYKFKGGRDYRVRLPWAEEQAKLRAAEEQARMDAALAALPFHRHVSEAARQFEVDIALVHAVIAAESAYNPTAVSEKGAVGLMQVMPATGARYGVREKDLRDPARNIRAGTKYLADLLAMFGGDVELALAGYNAGEQAVERYGRAIPPYAETRAYVPRVLHNWRKLRSIAM
ncbi:MAG: lytic transglycosylase domain-containing protein [Burkholderiales bacterium]|jgi:soluble lytic murein transglycosylase-like protein|nr:lytic transglycosylase domain-containing protein [Burkholderiales bacterium]